MKKIRKKEEDGELTQGQIRQIEKARARPAPPRPAPPRPARPAVAVQGDGQARDWAEPPPFGGQDEERVKELEASMLPQEEALALLLRQIGDSQLPKGQLRTGGRKAGAAGGDSDDEGGRSDDDEFYDRASVPPPLLLPLPMSLLYTRASCASAVARTAVPRMASRRRAGAQVRLKEAAKAKATPQTLASLRARREAIAEDKAACVQVSSRPQNRHPVRPRFRARGAPPRAQGAWLSAGTGGGQAIMEAGEAGEAGEAAAGAGRGDDSLDSFMSDMNQQALGKRRAEAQAKLQALEAELVSVNKLIKIATPALPSFAGATVKSVTPAAPKPGAAEPPAVGHAPPPPGKAAGAAAAGAAAAGAASAAAAPESAAGGGKEKAGERAAVAVAAAAEEEAGAAAGRSRIGGLMEEIKREKLRLEAERAAAAKLAVPSGVVKGAARGAAGAPAVAEAGQPAAAAAAGKRKAEAAAATAAVPAFVDESRGGIHRPAKKAKVPPPPPPPPLVLIGHAASHTPY